MWIRDAQQSLAVASALHNADGLDEGIPAGEIVWFVVECISYVAYDGWGELHMAKSVKII
jgi:hypothetical protein